MLKKLKLLIKILPFINTLIYLCCMGLYFCNFPDYIQDKIDLLIYFSPISAVMWLFLSVAAEFCKWHRIAILVPVIGVLVGEILYQLESVHIIVDYSNLIAICLLSVLTIFCGIKVLWRKR